MPRPLLNSAAMTQQESTADEWHSHADSIAEASPCVLWIGPEAETKFTRLSERDEIVIGRSPECDLVLAGTSMSRRHARLFRTGTCFFVEDRESHNGVSVNAERVRHAAISPGDVLRLGPWIGVLVDFAPDEPPIYGLLAKGIFGGPDIAAVLAAVRHAAASDLPVVLRGATGTGKECFARELHARSRRAGEFVAINCATYQGVNAVAELFGYRKGAFTGAERAHTGMIRAAEGGTLLLDEVTDLPLDVQAQLLRVLENRELIPLGEARAHTVDVRFLAATQQPLATAVAAGRFREDLRARLEGMEIVIPTLAERRGDAAMLFLHFLREQGDALPEVDAKLLERVQLYSWPLNVRELLAFTRRLLTNGQGATPLSLTGALKLKPELSAASSPTARQAAKSRPPDAREARSEEVDALRLAIERHGGSVAKAAAELGISRFRAYRLLKASD